MIIAIKYDDCAFEIIIKLYPDMHTVHLLSCFDDTMTHHANCLAIIG